MTPTTFPTPARVDLSTCDREPIHIPGSIQPHGVLLALRGSDLTIAQESANTAEWFGVPAELVLGRPLDALFNTDQAEALRRDLANSSLDRSPLYLRTVTAHVGLEGRPFRAVAHRHDGVLILELEPAATPDQVTFQDLYPVVRSFATGLEKAGGVDEVCRLAAEEVRRITGFDRVLVYRFDEDWNGRVIAESKNDAYPPYLDLHFPASDIPAQARELYRVNRFRLIPDARYAPVPILPATNPDTGRPLDLGYAVLRSVSPVHCEYLHNMGVVASMSVSVLKDGELWALVSCHHHEARGLPFEARTALELLGQMLSMQVASHEHAADIRHRIGLKAVQARLLAAMAAERDFVHGLASRPNDLLGLTDAAGAAVLYADRCVLVGATPSEDEVRRLADLIAEWSQDEVIWTDEITARLPHWTGLTDRAAGVLAVSISKLHRSFVLWFRPEVERTVTWAGDPTKSSDESRVMSNESKSGSSHSSLITHHSSPRISPRRSFERWKQTVRGRSRPWLPAEVAAAADLRNDVVGIVLRKAEERAQLTAELEQSNKELEAFSYSVSHDLRAPFRHIVGYAELLRDRAGERLDGTDRRYLDTIADAARTAGTLVDGLLRFSQMGRSALNPVRIDLTALAEEVRRQVVDTDGAGRTINWEMNPLPAVRADLMMLRLVFQNLFQNAVKFTAPRGDEARVEVCGEVKAGEAVVWVRDNGVGFDMRYVDKLFGVFQRLHKMEEFDGTGIGLANVRRIVARHGGRTWAEGKLGEGAAFFFSLPAAE